MLVTAAGVMEHLVIYRQNPISTRDNRLGVESRIGIRFIPLFPADIVAMTTKMAWNAMLFMIRFFGASI